MTRPARADVVVVGGGLPGLATAAWLAMEGVRVCLLEAETLGAGASGASPGLAVLGVAEHPWRVANSLGAGEAEALYRFSAESLSLLAALVAVGDVPVLWTAIDDREEEEVERSARILAGFGRPVARWSAAQVAEATGLQVGHGGLRATEEVLYDPADTVSKLAAAACSAGATLRPGCAVMAVEEDAGDLLVRTAHGAVRCDVVVFAAEAGLPALHPMLAHTLHPVREQSVALEGGPTPCFGLRTGLGWTSARGGAGGLVVAGCRWATPHLQVGETDATTTDPAVQERLEATARRLMPSIGMPSGRRAWITAHGCDGLPLVGPLPGDPRRLVCAGFAGHEAGLGLRAARALVDGLLTGRAEGVPACLRPDRLL